MGIASQGTRELALAAYEAGGATLGQIAKMFQVHRITLYRWIRTYRASGRTAPLPSGNRWPTFRGGELKRLDEMVRQQPDVTLEQLREGMGKDCSIMAVHRALRQLGWRYKKKRYERVSEADPT